MTAMMALAAMSTGCVLVVHPDEEHDTWQSDWDSDESSGQRDFETRGGATGLAERVAQSYGSDDLLRDADIRVTARENIVSLHGRVPSRAHLDRAAELAFGIDGVAAVESRLTVAIERPAPETEE